MQEMFKGKDDALAAYDGDGGGKVRCTMNTALPVSVPGRLCNALLARKDYV